MSRKSRKKSWVKRLFLLMSVLFAIIVICVIYQYKQGLSTATEQASAKDSANTPAYQPFNGEKVHVGEMKILLIGSDARPGERGRSDALMIAYYNQKTNQLKLASLMRDMYVEIPGYGMDKLNAAYSFGGPELVRQTVRHNFDMDINYYAIVDFSGFPKLIDLVAPDGVEVDVEKEMSTGIGMTLHPGKQVLHGDKLLGYVRFRKDSRSDFGRVERQQEVLSKVKDQAASAANLMKLPKILGMVHGYLDTNVDVKPMYAIGKGLIDGKNKQIESLRLPIKDSYTDERVDVGAVLNIDVEKNKQALQSFFSGSEE